MKKPYIKKYLQLSRFTVWIVDGDWIRKNLNEDFVGYDSHSGCACVPKGEFWVDKIAKKSEIHFYIDCLLAEHKFLEQGFSAQVAAKKAKLIEKRERSKLKLSEEFREKLLDREKVLKRIHKSIFVEYSGLQVWLVNGTVVRDLFLVDYAEGGHGYVYSFVPKSEIWMEITLSARERKFILLHELHERYRMAKFKENYPKAHASATRVEDMCRKNISLLAAALKKEVQKNLGLHRKR